MPASTKHRYFSFNLSSFIDAFTGNYNDSLHDAKSATEKQPSFLRAFEKGKIFLENLRETFMNLPRHFNARSDVICSMY